MPATERDRLREYVSEFQELLRMNATKEQLRNGANGKHGINHIVEVFNMLPGEASAEFKIAP